MPTSYSQFFLNSGSNIVQLETIEIYHPYFSKTYFIVRNAISGMTATLEGALGSQAFIYYPMKITPNGAYNDMDQTLQVAFGDLGQIIPNELDRLTTLPTVPVNTACLLGAWVDATGQMVVPPFLIGIGGNFYAPQGAVALQMGYNDTPMFDNSGSFSVVINGAAPVSVGATTRLYTVSGLINAAYPYAPTSSTAPISVAITPGELLQISVTGTCSYSSTSGLFNGLGNPLSPTGVPGSYVTTPNLPGTYTKPQLTYRTFRSDDLSGPLAGPYIYDIINIAFQKEGATFSCAAKRLNLAATGELYSMSRFPSLVGFL